METESQTMVSPDNLPERLQDMQIELQTGARPKEMVQLREEAKRSEVYPTNLVRSRSIKVEESHRLNTQSLSKQLQQLSESHDSLSTGNI